MTENIVGGFLTCCILFVLWVIFRKEKMSDEENLYLKLDPSFYGASSSHIESYFKSVQMTAFVHGYVTDGINGGYHRTINIYKDGVPFCLIGTETKTLKLYKDFEFMEHHIVAHIRQIGIAVRELKRKSEENKQESILKLKEELDIDENQ